VEGDSQIIIHLITKIIHGSHPLEVSPSWRLSGLLEEFGSLLQPNITLIPSHVKREANKVVDCLENEGVASTMELIQWNAQTSPRSKLSDRCLDLARNDYPIPDGVPRCAGRPRSLPQTHAINMAGRHPSPHH
jgi:hypothetical protein